MSALDPRTARLLAERMVTSFFDDLSTAELAEIIAGSGKEEPFPPLLSKLSYTFEVYLECVSLPEEQARDFFGCAVQGKLKELAERSARS